MTEIEDIIEILDIINNAYKHILKFCAPPKYIIRKPAKPPEPTWKAPIKPLAAPLFNLDEFILSEPKIKCILFTFSYRSTSMQ